MSDHTCLKGRCGSDHGNSGAGYLAPAVLDRYGQNGLAVIVDEGAGFDDKWGAKFAMPGVGEKGAIVLMVRSYVSF